MIRENVSTALSFMKQLAVTVTEKSEVTPGSLPTVNVDSSVEGFLKIVFAAITILSIIFVAVGGLKYTLSSGDSNGIQSAKNTILYAVIGLVIGISAFTIVSFVAGRL